MYNRLDVESVIMELKDLTVMARMIKNNAESITSAREFESLFNVVADALTSKVDRLQAAFYGNHI